MGTLELDNLTKIFSDPDEGEIVAVDEFNAEIKDGEFLILVGPSGCGKTTTLRCVAGLEQPTRGDILLDGESVIEKKPKARNMAMVFQNYALYPHMTARENMSFGLRMTTDLSNDEIDDRVNEAAEIMGIEDLLEKKPSELSGGQQQRVALGRAIVRDPEVFLMDEPLSNLDAKLRTQMRTELQDLQQDLGVTTVYVTHDQTEAMTMGDRIAVLNDGELQQIGSPDECYSEPANQFVAGFIGSPSMNFFDVELRDSVLMSEDFDVTISPEIEREIDGDGSEYVLGIRPEEILSEDAAEGGEDRFTIDVKVVEPLGDVTYLYADINGKEATIAVDRSTDLEPGDRISVAFPVDEIHLFDSQTGDAIINRGAPAADAFVTEDESTTEKTEA
ncbi:ABC transporter ATP-binding protein [Halorhabdus amylolytica]|uniref:ABC transporter ATP-binding protein n=1 Tax=Halorhabdus amylolytica TaxID=2559573 RepID=UPI0010AA1DA4|nr:ABC transporter ATP-binding protein [Halorhabdus amylolytica]